MYITCAESSTLKYMRVHVPLLDICQQCQKTSTTLSPQGRSAGKQPPLRVGCMDTNDPCRSCSREGGGDGTAAVFGLGDPAL